MGYQTGIDCPNDFECKHIRAHHKPTGKPIGRDCPKLALRTPAPPPSPPLPLSAEFRKILSLDCKPTRVHIGANCKCASASDTKYMEVDGFVKACEATTC